MSRTTAILERLRPPAPHVVIDASPPAERRRRSWWRDGRVLGGVAILLVCTVVGARLLASGDDSVQVWQAARDLASGTVPMDGDLVMIDVPAGAAAAYAPASAPLGSPLDRPVLAGEFIPVPMAADAVDARWVTLPVEPLHAPADLAPGDRIDVWSTSDIDLTVLPVPELVLGGVLVSAVTADAMGIGGEYGVTVEVDPPDAEILVTAVRSGALDIVRTPVVTP